MRPFFFDLTREFDDADRLDENLDARLVGIVAATVAVEYANQGLAVSQQMPPRQELAHHLADHRRAAKSATGIDLESGFTGGVLHDLQAEVMDLDCGTVFPRARNRNLELARQVGEFWMQGRPLAQDLGPGARVGDFVGGDAGKVVGRHIPDATARSLDRVQFFLLPAPPESAALLKA